MLPAEMAEGTRAQVQRRREEEEAAGEGDANPAPNPEVVLPNNQDGDNPFGIPDRCTVIKVPHPKREGV